MRNIFISTILFLFSFTCISQQSTFIRQIYDFVPVDIHETSDHGFVAFGSCNSFTNLNEFAILKTDASGFIQWINKYGTNKSFYLRTIVEMQDSGFIMLGNTDMSTPDDIFLIRVDKAGDTLWTKNINGGGISNLGFQMIRTSDDKIVIIGAANFETFVMKVDNGGNLVWSKAYRFGFSGYTLQFTSLSEMNDHGFVIAGWGYNLLMLKIDSSGIVKWCRSYGPEIGSGIITTGEIVKATNDGGAILAAKYNDTHTVAANDALLIKTDSAGVPQWMKRYRNVDELLSFDQTNNGDYVIGTDYSDTIHHQATCIIKINGSGSTVWKRTFPYFAVYITKVRSVSDGGLIVAAGPEIGTTSVHLSSIIKCDENGNAAGCEIPQPFSDTILTRDTVLSIDTISMNFQFSSFPVSVNDSLFASSQVCFSTGTTDLNYHDEWVLYPNPTKDKIMIEFRKDEEKQLTVQVVDMTGRLIMSSELLGGTSDDRFMLDVSKLNAGVYLLSLIGSTTFLTSKLIKE